MADLLLSTFLHAGLGILLACLVWTVGLGWRGGPAFAYPAGLLTVTAAAFFVLLTPWLAPAAAAVLIVPLVPRTQISGLRMRRLAWLLPATLGAPVALGLLLHGPTDDLDSHALGEVAFYAAKLVSAEQSVAPFRDLTVEGEPSVYLEAGSSFLGGALTWLPGLDPFLFQTTTLPAFLLASIPIGLGLAPRTPARLATGWVAVLAVLAAAMAPYPSWLTESPPMALALPLAFALYALAYERMALARLAALCALVALDLVLTKGFGLVLLAVLAAFAFGRDHARDLSGRTLALLGAGLAVLGALAVAAFALTSGWLAEVFDLKFLPADAARGLADQLDARDTQAAGPGLELIGLLALGLALVRARAAPLALGFAVMLLGHLFIGGHGFDILVGLSVLLAALHFWLHPDLLLAERWLVLGAAVALAVSAWFREVTGVRAGLVLVALLAVALAAAFAPRVLPEAGAAAAIAGVISLAGRPFLGAAAAVLVIAAAVLRPGRRRLVVAASIGAAAVVALAADLDLTPYAPALTTDHHAVWERVADEVPPGGLVFTSLTGSVVEVDQGWNYYAGVSGRQIYLAGWSNSILLVDEEERARRLRLNAEVLTGQREPGSVPLERRYSSFYAVVRAEDSPPPSFERLYANERFELYRIPS